MFRANIVAVLTLALLTACGDPNQQADPTSDHVMQDIPEAPAVVWRDLSDGSKVATYQIGLLNDDTTKRCWKTATGFDCIVVVGDEARPSGWWAERQQSDKLAPTALTTKADFAGYSCYGGGKRDPGITIGEVIGSITNATDSHYVKPPSQPAWTREHVEAAAGVNGAKSYFDCSALDKFLTNYGITALTTDRNFPRPF